MASRADADSFLVSKVRNRIGKQHVAFQGETMMRMWIVGCLACCLVGTVRGDEPSDSGSTQPTMDDLEAFAKLVDRDWKDRPEWVEMAMAILKRQPMGSGRGWYKPASKQYDWDWIAKAFPKATDDSVIEPGEVAGIDEARFKRLDRTQDGYFSKADLEHLVPISTPML